MIFAFIGPSGGGKSTIAEQMGIQQIISTTTRSIRQGEIDGVHYHFIDEDTFINLLKHECMLEFTNYAGNYYGLQRADVQRVIDSNKDAYCILDEVGIRYVKEKFGDKVVVIFVYAGAETLKERLKFRGENEDTIDKRISQVENELKNVHMADIVIDTTGFHPADAYQYFKILYKHYLKDKEEQL